MGSHWVHGGLHLLRCRETCNEHWRRNSRGQRKSGCTRRSGWGGVTASGTVYRRVCLTSRNKLFTRNRCATASLLRRPWLIPFGEMIRVPRARKSMRLVRSSSESAKSLWDHWLVTLLHSLWALNSQYGSHQSQRRFLGHTDGCDARRLLSRRLFHPPPHRPLG
jgi:hypothetical protein